MKIAYLNNVNRFFTLIVCVLTCLTTNLAATEDPNTTIAFEDLLEHTCLKCTIKLDPTTRHIPLAAQQSTMQTEEYQLEIFLAQPLHKLTSENEESRPLSHWHLYTDEFGAPADISDNARVAFMATQGIGLRADTMLCPTNGLADFFEKDGIVYFKLYFKNIPDGSSDNLGLTDNNFIEVSFRSGMLKQMIQGDLHPNTSNIDSSNDLMIHDRPIKGSNLGIISNEHISEPRFALQAISEIRAIDVACMDDDELCNKEHFLSTKEHFIINNALQRHLMMVNIVQQKFQRCLIPSIHSITKDNISCPTAPLSSKAPSSDDDESEGEGEGEGEKSSDSEKKSADESDSKSESAKRPNDNSEENQSDTKKTKSASPAPAPKALALVLRTPGMSGINSGDEDLKQKILSAKLPQRVEEAALREYERIKDVNTGQDKHCSRVYIEEWLLKLPWTTSTPDCLNMRIMTECLDASHYGQDEVKQRIKEYLAGMILRSHRKSGVPPFNSQKDDEIADTEGEETSTINTELDNTDTNTEMDEASDNESENTECSDDISNQLVLKRTTNMKFRSHSDVGIAKASQLEEAPPYIESTNDRGTILCLVGPPGTGKTSIAQSIARALNKKCIKISLGSVRRATNLVGFRKTYVGAEPGAIIKKMRECKTNNPVIVLDEVDKVNTSADGFESEGVLSSMLEILDPKENKTFSDHYIDIEFNLGKCVFICTANGLSGIPAPLMDRMEVITVPGYSNEEKLEIAKKHIIPKVLESYHIHESEVSFENDAIEFLINNYTKEEGVRELEKIVNGLVEKIIFNYFFNGDEIIHQAQVVVTTKVIEELLKGKTVDTHSWKSLNMYL